MAKEKFLLYMLAGIFAFQASIFGAGFYYCAKAGGLAACPKLGERYENTFNVPSDELQNARDTVDDGRVIRCIFS